MPTTSNILFRICTYWRVSQRTDLQRLISVHHSWRHRVWLPEITAFARGSKLKEPVDLAFRPLAPIGIGCSWSEFNMPEVAHIEQPGEVIPPIDMNDKQVDSLVKRRIADALGERNTPAVVDRPGGLTRAQAVVAVIGGTIAIFTGILLGINYIVTSAVTGALVQPGKDIAILTEQGKSLRKDIDRLLDKAALSDIRSPEKPQAVKQAALRLRERKLIASVQDVIATGDKLIRESPGSSDAWQASLALISYRSFLTASPLPESPPFRAMSPDFKFEFQSIKPAPYKTDQIVPDPPLHTYGTDVPIHDAARLESLGSNVNSDQKFGPRIIVVKAGDLGLKLDGLWVKGVVVMNTVVSYGGGPLILENVYFVDCEFKMNNVAPARKVGTELLAHVPATISANGA